MRHEVSGKSEKERKRSALWRHSFGCTTEPYKSAFANAQKKWKEMGYQLDLGPNCYAEHGIGISAAPEECGKELTEYYVSERMTV